MKMSDLESRKAEAKRSAIERIKGAGKPRTKKTVSDDNLRPSGLSAFIGQTESVAELSVMVGAANLDGKQLDHVLLTGPSGCGKTTIAMLLANEMGAPFIATTAPTLGQEPLVRMLSGMDAGTVVFVDEIHRLSKRTEELLYAALEDGVIDANTPAGPVRRAVEPFTLVGATNLPGMMTEALKNRFGHQVRLRNYTVGELTKVAARSAKVLSVKMTDGAAALVGERSRGVARVTNSHIRRLVDYARVHGHGEITVDVAEAAFKLFGIDELGLGRLDRELLRTLRDRFSWGPVGLTNLALACSGEEESTIRDDVEPWLTKVGLMMRAPRGRTLTPEGAQHLSDMEGWDE